MEEGVDASGGVCASQEGSLESDLVQGLARPRPCWVMLSESHHSSPSLLSSPVNAATSRGLPGCLRRQYLCCVSGPAWACGQACHMVLPLSVARAGAAWLHGEQKRAFSEPASSSAELPSAVCSDQLLPQRLPLHTGLAVPPSMCSYSPIPKLAGGQPRGLPPSQWTPQAPGSRTAQSSRSRCKGETEHQRGQ